MLNRIIGQDRRRYSAPLCQSNGRVYLINPNGILFGKSSQVSVGGLVASSLDISNSDFSASGKLNFNATASAKGCRLRNQGNMPHAGRRLRFT